MVVVEQMGKALKMEETEMREFFEDGMQSMRMNYYPPCPQPEKVFGLTSHSDAASEVEGLQIRKDGMPSESISTTCPATTPSVLIDFTNSPVTPTTPICL